MQLRLWLYRRVQLQLRLQRRVRLQLRLQRQLLLSSPAGRDASRPAFAVPQRDRRALTMPSTSR